MVTWLRVVTWIAVDNEKRLDEDGTPDPTLSHDLQVGLVAVDGVERVDGLALFPETQERKSPWNGGSYAREA